MESAQKRYDRRWGFLNDLELQVGFADMFFL
jgi:hypothetical protein